MFGFFRRPRQATSAQTAKERLQILLAHERTDRSSPDYLPLLQRDILDVIKRYVRVDGDSELCCTEVGPYVRIALVAYVGADRHVGPYVVNQPETCIISREQQASDWGVEKPEGHTFAALSAASTRSFLNGTRRRRTPVASKMALATAAIVGFIAASPAP